MAPLELMELMAPVEVQVGMAEMAQTEGIAVVLLVQHQAEMAGAEVLLLLEIQGVMAEEVEMEEMVE